MIFAVLGQNEEIVRLLARRGANRFLSNFNGVNALDVANNFGFTRIIQIMANPLIVLPNPAILNGQNWN